MSKPRVAYLAAGGAGMFCGSCMRDNTLAAALAKLDCDPWLIPTYTPIRTDEENVSVEKVFFGGVNVFLQQKSALFRWLPGILDRWLDAPWLLRRVPDVQVDARELGALALSMLRGEQGRQRKEVRRLTRWLAGTVKPDLVNLSNLLIAGCVPALKRALGVPVLCTLQGDDLFVDDLPADAKAACETELRRLANHVDAFLVFSEYYAQEMAARLAQPRSKFRLAPMGLAAVPPGERTPPAAPTVGYFARICPAKGFDRLVSSWLLLRRQPGLDRARLRAAGWLGASDRNFFTAQRGRIAAAGAAADFDYAGVLDRDAKFAFLRSLDVLSVPTAYREPKGIFVLEALACGVPVVQPAHGAFPELLAATGGGTLVPPGDDAALAAALAELLRDRSRREALGAAGQATVARDFTAARMAERTLEVFREFLPRHGAEVPGAARAGGRG